ncbi:hypothetical protein VCHA38O209_50257 [Vibrio chagasii]|nr:hypothetical protein VCHA38O209_50257 [Vibrio chagasii]
MKEKIEDLIKPVSEGVSLEPTDISKISESSELTSEMEKAVIPTTIDESELMDKYRSL